MGHDRQHGGRILRCESQPAGAASAGRQHPLQGCPGAAMIKVLSAGALATVQDLGRTGGLNLGVGTSGAMDSLALAGGNILLRNEENAAAVEVPVFPFKVRFERS